MAQNRTSFTVSTPPGTDVWRKPAGVDDFNAPYTESSPFPLSDFKSARVTFSGPWTRQFDQAGVLFRIVQKGTNSPSWIKCGLERFEDENRLSFVGCDRFADWSVHPVHGPSGEQDRVTVMLERQGQALWAYEVVGDKRYPLRECAWLWDQEAEKSLEVGAYTARPTKKDGDGEGKGDLLEVKFDELVVETK